MSPATYNKEKDKERYICEEISSTKTKTAFVRGSVKPLKALQYADVNGMAMFEGDIILGTVSALDQEVAAQQGQSAVALDPSGMERGCIITGQQYRWPSAQIPYEIDPALPNQNRVTDAIAHWEANTRIRFVPRTAANAGQYTNYVRFVDGSGCASYVGMRGGMQEVWLGAGCSTGNAIHEIGHTVGLWHEQSREDRDQFVTIHYENIIAGYEHNFNQHIDDGDDVGAYDYDSIMHYPANAFSKNGQPTIVTVGGQAIGQRNGLSQGDIAAVNVMYPAPKLLVKDLNDTKRIKDIRDKIKDKIRDSKVIKDRKDLVERKNLKDTKDSRDNIKRVKDVKDQLKPIKELQPIGPIPPIKPITPSLPGQLDFSTSPTGSLESRVQLLEEMVQQLSHFISPELRPDLDASALNAEVDQQQSELEMETLSADLQQQLLDAKRTKDTAETGKLRDV